MKLGFCFLSYGDIEMRDVWSSFFQGIDTSKYAIFIHRADGQRHTWMSNARVIPHRKTAWGSFQLLEVQQDLFTTAIADLEITKCILLSGDTIPLYGFDKIYDVLTADNKGYLEFGERPNTIHKSRERTTNQTMWPREMPWAWFITSQWCVLNRRHIRMLKDKWGMLCSVFDGSSIPDEHMYPTFFNGVQCMDTFHTRSAMYVDWCSRSRGCTLQHRPEPKTIHKNDLSVQYVTDMYNSGALFARKICRLTQLEYNWRKERPLLPTLNIPAQYKGRDVFKVDQAGPARFPSKREPPL